jgi:hypothetical protein
MDERKPATPSHERNLRPVSDGTSIAVDSSSAHLAPSADLVAPGRARHSDQFELCQNDQPEGPSVVVFCDNTEDVSRGFLIALRVMGVAVVEQPSETAAFYRASKKGARFSTPAAMRVLVGCA